MTMNPRLIRIHESAALLPLADTGLSLRPGLIGALLRLTKIGGYALLLAPEAQDSAAPQRREALRSLLGGEGIVLLMDGNSRADAGLDEVRWTVKSSESSGPFSGNVIVLGDDEVARRKSDSLVVPDWAAIATLIVNPIRRGVVHRKTAETEIDVTVSLDGKGTAAISTGLGFFDHMLHQIARHSQASLDIKVAGDLHVDEHHTIEDTAIALGEAFAHAIGDKRGMTRYGFLLPMDDALAQVALDFSGRSWLVWEAEFKREKVGEMPTEMFHHFFKSFADAARCNLNIKASGENEHHKIESIFKAVGRAMRMALERDEESGQIPSTKGVL